MAVFTAVCLTVGAMFLFQGAWPIFGFYGLDILLLYWALKHNYRSGRRYERVRLTERELIVEAADHAGRRRVVSLSPHWLRVSMDDPPKHESQVTLSSHGRSITVGSFLTPQERLDFAEALKAALDQVRQPIHLRTDPSAPA